LGKRCRLSTMLNMSLLQNSIPLFLRGNAKNCICLKDLGSRSTMSAKFSGSMGAGSRSQLMPRPVSNNSGAMPRSSSFLKRLRSSASTLWWLQICCSAIYNYNSFRVSQEDLLSRQCDILTGFYYLDFPFVRFCKSNYLIDCNVILPRWEVIYQLERLDERTKMTFRPDCGCELIHSLSVGALSSTSL
jgi:hypothetical protein